MPSSQIRKLLALRMKPSVMHTLERNALLSESFETRQVPHEPS
jgi:hypothetical protein